MKEQRTHDHFYVNEDRYDKPKSSFLQIIELLKKNIKNPQVFNGRMCDFGCATGEFIYLLQKDFINADIHGYDILQPLIEHAKLKTGNKKTSYFIGDVRDEKLCENEISDITFLLGVLPAFDRFETTLQNLINWTKDKGIIYVHSLFNKYPVDVYTKYNYSKDYEKGVIEVGWNQHSRESISNWLKKNRNVSKFSFVDLKKDFDLPFREEDPMRSWTYRDKDNNRQLTNGASLIHNQAILEIFVNK